MEPGTFVTVHLINCVKVPVIGKITQVKENEFSIHYWKGSYNKAWAPHMVKSGRKHVPWVDNLPKQSVIICRFQLDKHNKLQQNTRKYLKAWYKSRTSVHAGQGNAMEWHCI